jgi:hypothetical protein
MSVYQEQGSKFKPWYNKKKLKKIYIYSKYVPATQEAEIGRTLLPGQPGKRKLVKHHLYQ